MLIVLIVLIAQGYETNAQTNRPIDGWNMSVETVEKEIPLDNSHFRIYDYCLGITLLCGSRQRLRIMGVRVNVPDLNHSKGNEVTKMAII